MSVASKPAESLKRHSEPTTELAAKKAKVAELTLSVFGAYVLDQWGMRMTAVHRR